MHASLLIPTVAAAAAAAPASRPHLVFHLLDDVGWYNAGFAGNAEARTPHMDALAADGVVLSRHYAYKFCSPSRSAFLSGRLPVHVNTENRGPSEAGGVHLGMSTVADVLRRAGYATHQVGKWHAGSSAWGNLPVHRGFDSSLGYMGGVEDHYTQHGGYKDDGGSERTVERPEYVDDDLELTEIVDLWDTLAPAYGENGTYNAYSFSRRAVDIVRAHDPARPLFLYLAWQEAHVPNEVPHRFLSPRGAIGFPLRRVFEGMVHAADSAIGNVTAALKARGMYERSLIVATSDNGGREDGDFGGNNYPLRGAKFSDFEGGVRVLTAVGGGALPAARRGVTEHGLVHIADWLSTFASLAGEDPTDGKAAALGLPPIDSMDMSGVILRGAPSPRSEIVLSDKAYIRWPLKVVIGRQAGAGVWTGPRHPNASTKLRRDDPGCPRHGCLFNISRDPTEHHDLAKQSPQALRRMMAAWELALRRRPPFQTDDTPGYTRCTTVAKFAQAHRGFGGPICSKPREGPRDLPLEEPSVEGLASVDIPSAGLAAEGEAAHPPPANTSGVQCSAPRPGGGVLHLSDGMRPRCVATVLPPAKRAGPFPVLFWFHGSGGSAKLCGHMADKETGEALADKAARLGFALVCGEAVQFNGPRPWYGGQWLLPEVVTNATGNVCDASAPGSEARYLSEAIAALAARPDTFDVGRLFFSGCSMGSAFSTYAATCTHAGRLSATAVLTAFATHSTGLKVKGDGNHFPADDYNPSYAWGECPACQFFPIVPPSTPLSPPLKACVFDNLEDPSRDDPFFYRTSLALADAWRAAGNNASVSIGQGGHCDFHSWAEILSCLDDGTGRLLPRNESV